MRSRSIFHILCGRPRPDGLGLVARDESPAPGRKAGVPRCALRGACSIAAAVALAVAAGAQPNPPDDAGQKKVIADATAQALSYWKDLPDFVCRQVTRRNEDPKGLNQWRTLETVSEQLSFVNHKEEYRTLAINGKKVSNENRASGLMRSSEFADVLSWIFDPKAKAEVSWSQWDALRGHRVHVLGFRVLKENSKFVITKGKGQPITAGLFGVLNVDSESGSVLKIGLVATDIPATYPAQQVAIELHYEFAKIGDHYYLLPFRADLHSKEGKAMVWNEVEFHDFARPAPETAAK